MPLDLSCPKCNHVFPVTEARHPIGVQCPGCEVELTAEFRKVPPPVAPGHSPYELLVSVGKLPGLPPALPSRGTKLRLDDEPPLQRGGGSMLVVVLAGIGALVITLGGLAVTGYVLFSNLDTATAATKRSTWSEGGGGWRPNPDEEPTPGGGTKGNTKGSGSKGGTIPNRPFDPPKSKEPKNTFVLRPVPGSLTPITPPAAIDPASPKTILLPGKAEAVAVGGGGRYIVLHFSHPGRLAVFDANTGAIEHEIGTENGPVNMAAGANKLVMTVPGSRGKLRVYSLPELKHEKEFDGVLFHGINALAMGSRTNGPLLTVDVFGHVVLMDIATGKPIEGSDQEIQIPNGQLRASADGKLFVAGNDYRGNHKFIMLDESGKQWRKRDPDIIAAYPGANAQALFGKNQIIDVNGNRLIDQGAILAEDVWYVPAVTATGDYFLRVHQITVGKWPQEKKSVSIGIHKEPKNGGKPVLTPWAWLPETEGFFGAFNEPVGFDRHLFLIPEAKLLVIMNAEKTKLIVRRIQI